MSAWAVVAVVAIATLVAWVCGARFAYYELTGGEGVEMDREDTPRRGGKSATPSPLVAGRTYPRRRFTTYTLYWATYSTMDSGVPTTLAKYLPKGAP